MKTADVTAMRASLESAREYVLATKRSLEELRQRRAQIAGEIQALEAKPLRWTEAVDEIVEVSINDCADRYTPSLGAWIRAKNPNIDRRTGYASLPFLGVPIDGTPELLQGFGEDGVSAMALCFFFPDLLKPRLRELLLTHPAPYPAEQCIGRKERDAQRKQLREQAEAVDSEIAALQAELDQLKGI